MLRFHPPSLTFLVGWPRRLLVLGCLVLAAADACSPGAAPAGHGRAVRVLVAARAISPGRAIVAADLSSVAWPADLAPASRLSEPTPVLGRLAVVAIARGEPITLARIVGSALTAGLAADELATAVTVTTDVTAFIAAGVRIDLLRAPPEASDATSTATAPPTIAVRSARVLAVLGHPTTTDADGGTELLVAAPRSDAGALAGLAGARVLAVVGRSP